LETTLDVIISTRNDAKTMPLKAFLSMLYIHGKFVTVGMPEEALPTMSAFDFFSNGCYLGSSKIGSKKEAIQMLQLAADKGIKPW
jgi:alcohol dehydrogenase (NADP+)